MVKIQHLERENKQDQIQMTIPISKARKLDWLEQLQEGEKVEVDVSLLPDLDGLSVREI